ncbi:MULTISPECIES: SDR family oxidoreductase [Acinetobacter]|jgi:NAD(P)-dependent dehydrogenase (short-subunit alcohol dehydrogenase family)|uniref:SDR family oxidoreductase n=1 Tax=Acinetobacter TaxID=469 RepID=UPI0003C116A7|nr:MULTISPECIES: SDR family oxidoreductase [Acinetobacter]KEC83888.1 dehydrogenase [Acinetobacter sp. ETR1]MCG7220451.1 SDR family oxidoreductase [Acinetobacter sp. AG3]MDI1224792.1 SDR family oxidoreductase [Acinetobacter sp.]MDN5416421.1 SDR family oxidoreductase [Acinetobacter sp.]MDN5489649.1 SDR family oxidoreductase [Acinetobacter sp.]
MTTTSKTIIITGANTGIGLATAETFIKDGHHVIIACRNPEKAKTAQQHLESFGTGQVDVIHLDLNSLEQINQAANEIIAKYEKIDVLVNNAGMMTPDLEATADGFEKQFGVNYLGPFLWTLKLLPLVQKAQQGRVIHLASMMHLLGRIQPENFNADQVKKYNGVLSYGNSKLANLLFSNILAKQLQGSHVTSNALHPGGVDSEIYRELPKWQYAIIKLGLIPPSKPAELIKKIAFDPSWEKRNGDYVSLQTPAFKSGKAKDIQLAQKLYDESYALVKDYL